MGSKEDAPKKRISLSLRLDHAENVLIRHLVPPARPRPKNSRYFHDGGQIVVATRLRLQHTPRLSSAHFFSKQPNRDTWKIEIIKKENLEKTEPLEHLNESKIEAVGSSRALNWACQPGHLDFTHVFLLFLSSGNFLELRFFRCWLTFCGYMEPKGTKAKCW